MAASRSNGTPASGRERRRFERFDTCLDMAARRGAPGPRARNAWCRMQLHDFSLDGLRAESAVRLEMGEHVTVHLSPNSGHLPLELTGRVVQCRRESGRYQIGIQFEQTREGAVASPWWQLSRLFSLAWGNGRERSPQYQLSSPGRRTVPPDRGAIAPRGHLLCANRHAAGRVVI